MRSGAAVLLLSERCHTRRFGWPCRWPQPVLLSSSSTGLEPRAAWRQRADGPCWRRHRRRRRSRWCYRARLDRAWRPERHSDSWLPSAPSDRQPSRTSASLTPAQCGAPPHHRRESSRPTPRCGCRCPAPCAATVGESRGAVRLASWSAMIPIFATPIRSGTPTASSGTPPRAQCRRTPATRARRCDRGHGPATGTPPTSQPPPSPTLRARRHSRTVGRQTPAHRQTGARAHAEPRHRTTA